MIRGASGAGKSDLALRCLAVPAGFAGAGSAQLVADDQTVVRVVGGEVLVSAPPQILGLIEVRGLGLVRRQAIGEVPLVLVVDLVGRDQIERMPSRSAPSTVLGTEVRHLTLWPWELSAPLKLLLALSHARHETD